MTIGERIKQMREAKKMSQDELARAVGYKSRSTIGKIELGKMDITQSSIVAIAKVLSTTPGYLMGWEDESRKPENFSGEILAASTISAGLNEREESLLTKYRALDYFGKKTVDGVLTTEYERCTAPDEDEQPTIQIRHSNYKVSAGVGFSLSEGDDWEEISVPDTPETRKADYALTIQGNSMEPVFRNNDIILVKQQDAVDLGQIGIFVLNGAGYIKKNGGDRLISLNDEFDDIMIEEHDRCKCVGKVICRL